MSEEIIGLLDGFEPDASISDSSSDTKEKSSSKKAKKNQTVQPSAPRIISIIPAPGVFSMYKGSQEDGIECVFYPLVCWALVDNGKNNEVVGMDTSVEGGVSLCTDFPDFIGYVTEQEIKDMETERERNATEG